MPVAEINGIRMSYETSGRGEPVVLVMGTGARGRTWHLHQVPALLAAGFSTVTFDNRGVSPTSAGGPDWTIDDMVRDTVALMTHLNLAPCRMVGFSLGSYVVQELALAYPEHVRQIALIAARGRSDGFHRAITRAEINLVERGVEIGEEFYGAVDTMRLVSPRTFRDERQIAMWLESFQMARAGDPSAVLPQLRTEIMPNRLAAYHGMDVPCLVIGFEDDIVSPAHLGREVADSIGGARYVEIERCGHLGYLESPDEVNKHLVEFFRG